VREIKTELTAENGPSTGAGAIATINPVIANIV
jgi:hypothetical protein